MQLRLIANTAVENRRVQVDYIRAIATVGVVCIHAVAGYFLSAYGDALWHGFNALDALCRYAVPLFFMISGLFHIENSRYRFSSFIAKAVKLFFVFLFWQFIYIVVADKPFCLKSIIAPHYHLWFLPMIAVMYVLTPLINKWLSKVHSLAVYVVAFLLMGVYSLYTGNVIRNISILSVIGCASYYLLGYKMQQDSQKMRTGKWVWAVLFAISWIATGLGTYLLSDISGVPNECLYSYSMPNILLGSVALYMLLMQIKPVENKHLRGVMNKVLMPLSSYSFGIYLIHPIFIALLFNSSYLETLPMVKCLLTVVISLFASLLLSVLISKIPYLSKVILK